MYKEINVNFINALQWSAFMGRTMNIRTLDSTLLSFRIRTFLIKF